MVEHRKLEDPQKYREPREKKNAQLEMVEHVVQVLSVDVGERRGGKYLPAVVAHDPFY